MRRIMTAVLQGHTHIAADDAATLAWLVTAGADALVADAPRNWLAAPVSRPAPADPVTTNVVARTPTPAIARTGAHSAATAADDVAADASDLAGLDAALAEYAHPLRRPGVMAQLWLGAPDTAIAVLCDQPEPAGSPAALLRERMLAAIGLAPDDHAIGHVVPWPLTGARAPRPDEVAAFAPFLARAIDLARPKFILALGQAAAALAGDTRGIASLRGQWLSAHGVPLLATFHPRQLLNQPEMKRLAWADLQAFAARATIS
jgi:DNA polymerase